MQRRKSYGVGDDQLKVEGVDHGASYKRGTMSLGNVLVVVFALCCLCCLSHWTVVEEMKARALDVFFTLLGLSVVKVPSVARAAPPGFPSSGNGIWFTTPGTVWAFEYLPIGNGYLAAMTPGGTTQETTQLNIESLWSGGPFADQVCIFWL